MCWEYKCDISYFFYIPITNHVLTDFVNLKLFTNVIISFFPFQKSGKLTRFHLTLFIAFPWTHLLSFFLIDPQNIMRAITVILVQKLPSNSYPPNILTCEFVEATYCKWKKERKWGNEKSNGDERIGNMMQREGCVDGQLMSVAY